MFLLDICSRDLRSFTLSSFHPPFFPASLAMYSRNKRPTLLLELGFWWFLITYFECQPPCLVPILAGMHMGTVRRYPGLDTLLVIWDCV